MSTLVLGVNNPKLSLKPAFTTSEGIKSFWRIFGQVQWETETLRVGYMDAKGLLVWWIMATHLVEKIASQIGDQGKQL